VTRSPRIFLSVFGVAGHVFPAIALSRALRERGFDVWLETRPRWRETIEDSGARFVAAPDYIAFPDPLPGMPARPTMAESVRSLEPAIRDVRPDLVVNDLFTLPAALAAEAAGLDRATMIAHPYPVNEPGMPYFMVGLLPPRTPLGTAALRIAQPWFARRQRRQRSQQNAVRAELGLPPTDRMFATISEELVLVGTFPQLEYPRRWPAHVHVTGPWLFEPPHPPIDIPDGDGPLVVVAASTAQDPELGLVGTALDALADERLRVLVTLSGQAEKWQGETPANATLADWVPYAQLLPHASLMVSNGGHGTAARSLAEGVPLIVRPAGTDQGENGARVAWAGVGLMLPRGVFGRRTLRLAVRHALGDDRLGARARALADWSRHNDGAARGADLLSRHAAL
jgi:MGT family glycosyltransferase